MRLLVLSVLSMTLFACTSSEKKSDEVLKTADELSLYISNQRANLSESYKSRVRTYRGMLTAGFNKRKSPMPELLKDLTQMRKLALEVRGKMSSMTSKTRRLQDITKEYVDVIDRDQPEYVEIEELEQKLQVELGQLEAMAKKYGQLSKNFSALVSKSDVYSVPTEDLRFQAEEHEQKLNELIDQSEKKAKTAADRKTFKEIQTQADKALNMIDRLLPRLKADEVTVGPKNDPRDILVRIQKLRKKAEDLAEEL